MLKFAIYEEAFFNFWYNITLGFIIRDDGSDTASHPATAVGYIPTVIYLFLTLVILFNIPKALKDIIKYLMGKRDGKEKMTDLVRATITVDMN